MELPKKGDVASVVDMLLEVLPSLTNRAQWSSGQPGVSWVQFPAMLYNTLILGVYLLSIKS